MRTFPLLIISCLLFGTHDATAFSVHKQVGTQPGPTLLLFGGIQGDEPGGFMAADLLLTHYTITRGQLWVVPNLNFSSIIARSRGLYGDMNRKFAELGQDDPEYALVEEIKALIREPQVSGVVNLHDGSGFYRQNYVDRMHNSARWGQATIIDQALLPEVPYGALETIARGVRDHVNAHLLDAEHRFSLKNTRTRDGDKEMAKSLSFYAINQGKPAFAVEASKAFGTVERVYYHLLAAEAYLKAFGISFERDFTLSTQGVAGAIGEQPQIAFYDRRVVLDLADARRSLSYLPMKRGAEVNFFASSPLVALTAKPGGYQVSYGNNHMTLLRPQYMEFDDSLGAVVLERSGTLQEVPFGTIVAVEGRAAVRTPAGYRVNLIGYTGAGQENEAGLVVGRVDFNRGFSVDQGGWLYRAEVYREKRFCGMVLLDFSGHNARDIPKWRVLGRASDHRHRSVQGAGNVTLSALLETPSRQNIP
jgi:hypothetical protein